MHLKAVTVCLLAASTVVSSTPTPDKGSSSFGVNININGSVNLGDVWDFINTGVSGFLSAEGMIDRPLAKVNETLAWLEDTRNEAKGKIKDMWRKLEYKIKADKVEIRSRLEKFSDYRFRVSTDDGYPRIRAWLHGRDTDSDEKFFSTYAVAFMRVVEVNDTISVADSTSFINLSRRSNRGSWSSKAWSAFTAGAFGIDGSTVLTANTTFTDPAGSGFRFNLSTFLAQATAPMINATGAFSPNAIKYSIGLSGFPFKYENSHLVIVKTIWSKEIQGDVDAHRGTVGLGDGNLISWNSTAAVKVNDASYYASAKIEADHVQTPITGDDETTEKENGEVPKSIFFHIRVNGLTNASSIEWDPEIGVAEDASSTGSYSGGAASTGCGRMVYLLGIVIMCVLWL